MRRDDVAVMDREECHNLRAGETFSWSQDVEPTLRVEGELIDYWGDRQILYRAPDGLHAHTANHDEVWVEHRQ